MSTITRVYFNEITNDDSMDDWAIKDLVTMLENYLDEHESEEEV